jgi:hypothetical protein
MSDHIRLKIISSGNFMTTKIVNAETGQPLYGVRAIKWEANVDSYPNAIVTLELLDVEVEIEGGVSKSHILKLCPECLNEVEND